MKNPILIGIIAMSCFLFSCSSTEYVYLSVVKPAPVTLPQYIKNVGVVNRTQVADQNKVIDVVDKVVSLAGPNLDKEGAQATITGLTDELTKNNKFNQIKALTNTDLRTNVPGVFPAPLSWDVVQKICKDNNMDALFALELFHTDSKVNIPLNPAALATSVANIALIASQASMATTVRTGWRIYDPVGKNILDEYSMANNINSSAQGINPIAAAKALAGRKDAVEEVGIQAGQCYAQRIIPYWLRVSRDYFVRGTNNFRIARRKAQTGNWNEAADLWQRETSNPSRKVAGRACYNMAIISEINGDLDKAIQWAQKAYENYNIRIALHYVKILQYRENQNQVLQDQQPQQTN